jgi:hypothetical protein
MPATVLGEHALTFPSSGTRPTGSQGMIRHNSTNNSYEGYHNLATGTDGWYGLGEKQLVARSVRGDAWNTFDLVWGHSGARYTMYQVYWCFVDANTNASRIFCQVYDASGTLWSPSGGSGYTYTDNWGAANDGGDGAGTNFNSVNAGCNSSIPISNWNTADSGYWSAATGETHQAGSMNIYSGLPCSRGSNWPMFEGTYQHYSVSYSSVTGRFGGSIFNTTASQTATNGTTYYPITGLRFGYLDGYTNRSGTITAIVTVYGLTGTEEREM